MAPKRKPIRHPLLCPVCKRPQNCLSVHLRKVCMKTDTREAIKAVVKKEKRNLYELESSGRVFSQALLLQIMDDTDPLSRMTEELQRRHIVVTGVPPPPPNANVVGATTQQPQSVAAEAAESEAESEAAEAAESGAESGAETASVSSSETFQCNPDVQRKKVARKLMAEKGLYEKHSMDYPLLKDFATYLEKDLQNENYKQEVDNVARFLYYADPQAPSLEFVRNREKISQYLRELSEAKLTKQTQQNYLKSLKRFLSYHTVNTNLRHVDRPLFEDCKHFIEFIGSLQKCCPKQVSKEITQKSMLTEQQQLTPHDCLAVLRAAKKDFMAVVSKVFLDKNVILEMAECSLVVYYLQAVVILKHLQRPGVVTHMTVQEWEARTRDSSGNVIIGVKGHKTAAQQVATFALSQEEERWFDMYYTRVRPQLLKSPKKHKRDESGDDEEQEHFFISTTGRPIYNSSKDLKRLHSKYKLKPVTNQEARRVFETATKTMTDAEKSLVADYLTHSTATEENHYRMKQPETIVMANQLLARLAGDSSVESADEGPSHATRGAARDVAHKPACATNVQMDVQAAFDRLLETHPVTLDGDVPNKTERTKVSQDLQRQLYERWLKAQMKLRVQHVLSYFCRRLPTENRVSTWISKQGWKSNLPTSARIIKEWKPSGSVDIPDTSR
ncbi:uncharacterized protein LOC121611295 isoform X2 [Chelmon rostratus]|uniref:uncharacterized protein LOC121611295 isoform X2 n=1 Tax=Chelmon rostratus TaxID=109905 RepID=UPI001BE6DB3F|nr:uncharacterized protein LOC121611295 isoform X2 [Chelmon rostratus]